MRPSNNQLRRKPWSAPSSSSSTIRFSLLIICSGRHRRLAAALSTSGDPAVTLFLLNQRNLNLRLTIQINHVGKALQTSYIGLKLMQQSIEDQRSDAQRKSTAYKEDNTSIKSPPPRGTPLRMKLNIDEDKIL